jgi:hypothetical protein
MIFWIACGIAGYQLARDVTSEGQTEQRRRDR